MTQEHPLVERYLARLRDGLSGISVQDRDEVVSDIRSHFAEAVAAGSPLDAVLASLGPADKLARAYAVELLLNPAAGGRPRTPVFQRYFALASLLAVTSIPTLVVVTALGAVAVAFVSSGAVVFLAGVLNSAGVALPLSGVSEHPALTLAIGPLLLAVGAASTWALFRYLRWLARAVLRRLPATS